MSNANINSPEAQLAHSHSARTNITDQGDINFENYLRASLLVKVGQEEKAVGIYEDLLDRMDPAVSEQMLPKAAIACMRLGEKAIVCLTTPARHACFLFSNPACMLFKRDHKKPLNCMSRSSKSIWRIWSRAGCSISLL